MELSKRVSMFSSDPDTKGFDLSAGNQWIYPLNYQLREYQYNITKNALFNNTLVCLPTGLGKTLIAAVVMYNFWRWYPQSKIVFLAPTKPLVAQQISACHNIMGIPSTDTIELTGSMNPKNRQVAWFTKRVIFATPQVFQNDLEKEILSGELVRCVIIDEAHKALGKHAYCESIRLLRAQNSCFRVLALSATPGSKIEDVCHVMKNLLISNLELRDETSPDIIPYLNKRQMDIILVPLDKDLARFKDKYVSIMDHYVRLLVHYNILKGDASTISKGRIFYVYKEFQAKTNRPSNYGQIMKTISRCISLYHAYELLIRHGLRAFATFCQSHAGDVWMSSEPALQSLIDEISSFLGPFPELRPLPDGSVEEIPNDLVFGHTKFYKLKSLLIEHFEKFTAKNEETRAIVFVEYRDSVNEVYVSLLQLRPILRPKMFVGQAGQKRKQQMQAMAAFRNNEANVLISTSVGEEGLDVGEVDLIVCFDISQSSPIRLVQRMGRTGRRRDGRIVMLVTDGKEHQALKSTIAKKDSLNKKVLHSSNVVSALYQESPRMVPPDFDPVCLQMHIVPQPKTPAGKGKRKRKEKEDDPPKEIKRKATAGRTHTAVSGDIEKGKTMQSSMLKFLQKPSTSKGVCEYSTQVSQSTQGNQLSVQTTQPECIKLFTSDSAAIEFLTLCAIKASKLDDLKNDFNRMDETYLRISSHDDMDNVFDYPVPDLDILNCISRLEERMESPSPQEFIEDYEFGQIHEDVYIPDNNQSNAVEYRDTNNPPAVGKFDYEDLFEDSCESDETIFGDQRSTILDHKLQVSSKHQDHQERRSDKESNKVKERLSQNNGDKNYAELLEDDFFENSSIVERLFDQVSHTNKKQCEEEKNRLKIGCFESILDSSSDSDIPSSQTDLDFRRNVKSRETSSAKYYDVSGKGKRVEVEESRNKPSTSFGSNSVSGNHNKIHRNNPNMKSNKCLDGNKPFQYNDGRASCLSNVSDNHSVKVNTNMNTSSRFFSSKQKEPSGSGIEFDFKTEGNETVVKAVNSSINKTSDNNENINKKFGFELVEVEEDDDDDVIFVGEISTITRDNESRGKSIDETFLEDDNNVVFEKELSFAERNKEANRSDADSSKATITQILELIENSTSRKVNLSKISKSKQNLSNSNKSGSAIEAKTTQVDRDLTLNDKKALKDQSNIEDPCTSNYFGKKRDIDVISNTEEPLFDLDLSDIKWEDDFHKRDDKTDAVCSKTTVQIKEQINSDLKHSRIDNRKINPSNKKEESFKTNSDSSEFLFEAKKQAAKSVTDNRKISPLIKKEESFKTNSDSSGLLFQPLKITEKSSPVKTMDFDLADYEWESDFETPANPVASLKQFSNSNSKNRSSEKKTNNSSPSGLGSRKSSPKSKETTKFSSFVPPVKKKLSLKKKEIHKPSTSKDLSKDNDVDDDDSDSEEDFFRKFDNNKTQINNHHPTTNYVSSVNRNPMISKESKFSNNEKENTEPNSGRINLRIFSSDRKDHRDLGKVPFSKRVVTNGDGKKVYSLDRDRLKRRKKARGNRERIKSEFLDYEAEVSSNTSSGTSGEDDDLEGFVSHTQHEPVTIDMQAHYLQSLNKDLHRTTDPFRFKKPRTFVPDDEVFSQPMSQVDESSYVYDSFCVSGGEDDMFTETHEDSLLELNERKLNDKKRKRLKSDRTCVPKKRKVTERVFDSGSGSSSDDETEKLRKQILEESMMLKRNKN